MTIFNILKDMEPFASVGKKLRDESTLAAERRRLFQQAVVNDLVRALTD